MTPHPSRVPAIAQVHAAILAVSRAILLCAPNGSGTFLIAVFLLSGFCGKLWQSAFRPDAVSAVEQASPTSGAEGIPHIRMRDPRMAAAPCECPGTKRIVNRRCSSIGVGDMMFVMPVTGMCDQAAPASLVGPVQSAKQNPERTSR